MKSTFSGLQFCRWQYGTISIRLAVFTFQMYEIARNSKKIRTYSSSRSSKAIDLGVNRKPICDFISVIIVVTLVFEIFTVKVRKLLILPTPPLFDAPSGGTPWGIDVIYTPLKSAFNGLQYASLTLQVYLLSFSCGQWWRQDLRTGRACSRAQSSMVGPQTIWVSYYKFLI